MRRVPLALALAAFAAACSDQAALSPEAESAPPPVAAAVSHESSGGREGFHWHPPIVQTSSTPGTFNANLAPEVTICALEAASYVAGVEEPRVCLPGATVARWGPGEVTASGGIYQVNWKTDDPAQLLMPLDEDTDYRVSVHLGSAVLGFADLDPRVGGDPSGREGYYDFQIGSTIPLKFWIAEGVLCEVGSQTQQGTVIECTEGTIYDALGGTLALYDEGDPLGVTVPPDGLPDTDPVVTFRLERIALAPGQDCIEGLDLPTFGPCLRITTLPEVFQTPLEYPSVVSVCINPFDYTDDLALPSQWEHFQLYREPESQGPIQGLANVPSTVCPESFQAPASNNVVARLLRPLTRILGPQPLAAIHRGRGGEVEEVFEFSTYTWALPTQLFATAGQDQVGTAGAPAPVDPQVRALDEIGDPVQNARVHFEVADGNGVVVPAVGYTDANGYLSVEEWVLGDAGLNTLSAWGLGFFGEDEVFTSHDFSRDIDGPAGATFSATAAGVPASVTPTDPDLGEVEVATTLPEPLTVTVLDDGSSELSYLGVPGVEVQWAVTQGNGTLQQTPAAPALTQLTTVTGLDGTTRVVFTLGTLAGINTVAATVGDLPPAVFTAVGTPGAPASLTLVSGDGQSGDVNQQLPDPIVVRVADEFDNAVDGVSVSFDAGPGGGTFAPNPATTDGTGLASALWTLGSTPGPLSADASVGGGTLSVTAVVTAEALPVCAPGEGTATIDGVLGDEWECAHVSGDYLANLGGDAPTRLYWMNDAHNLYLAVVVEGADRLYDLRFDFDNDDDGVAEAGDDAFNFAVLGSSFRDEYLTQRCENSSQSGCGEVDTERRSGGTAEGAGAYVTTGNVTVYEFSKPLDSSDDAHDFSLTGPDTVGLFWTFRGDTDGGGNKGAKGNSQIPGFRNWLSITIGNFQ